MRIVIEKRYEESEKFGDIVEYVSSLPGLEVIVKDDEGLLEPDELSPYRYFVTKQNQCMHQEKDLFYNDLAIPEFWDVRASGLSGEIRTEGEMRAKISFKEPIIKRNVGTVEWYDGTTVYKKDYYDKWGLKYCSEYFSEEGIVETRTYYSDTEMEVVVEHVQNEVVFLRQAGKLQKYFESYFDFVKYFAKEYLTEKD